MTINIPEVNGRLIELRREAAGLIALIDTAYLPNPRRIREPHENLPGPEWQVPGIRGDGWTAHVTTGEADVIYVHHPGDMTGDVQPMHLDYARRVAMMLLAACDWADRNRPPPPDVPVLATARTRRRTT